MAYITSQGEELLKGSVRIDPDPAGTSGILCACCDTVISCSQFESHAGRGSRRAPYDNIFTADGLSLRKVLSCCVLSPLSSCSLQLARHCHQHLSANAANTVCRSPLVPDRL